MRVLNLYRAILQHRRLYERVVVLEKQISRQGLVLKKLASHVTPLHSSNKITLGGKYWNSARSEDFYKAFEDKFRGTEDEIKTRLLGHISLFTNMPEALKNKPVLDIGCGRGEMLGILGEHNLKAVGVDTNKAMVNHAVTKGYSVYAIDALNYLNSLKTNSLAAITGFHIIEHIPFESLMDILSESYRTVARDGFVLFETPNPETFSVGAHTFYLDPSHRHA